MRFRNMVVGIVLTIPAAIVSLPAYAQLTAITTADSAGLRNLTSLTANGTVYNVASLIKGSLNHYNSTAAAAFNNVYQPGTAPAAGTRAGLLFDNALNTGLTNIGFSAAGLTAPFTSSTPGINVVFNSPIQNRPGIDLVLFEIDTASGNPVRVSRSDGGATFTFASGAYTINTANLTTNTFDMTRVGPPNGGAASLTEYQNNTLSNQSAATQNIRGLGIDLSSLGFTNGQTVSSLFFQGTVAPTAGVDPSFIAGLPAVAVPESGTSALILSGVLPLGIVLLRRRSMHRSE